MLYAFFDSIINLTGGVDASRGLMVFLKVAILVVFGFLIGLIISILQRIYAERSFFEYRIALISGIIPFILLILSNTSITNFIAEHMLGSNRQLSEMLFYFLSRQVIFAVWLGFSIGVSVRVAFRKRLMHEKVYNLENEQLTQP
jgi:ABC-type methionine transport system permease subunit